MSIGFDTYASQPAARARSASPCIASAVQARIRHRAVSGLRLQPPGQVEPVAVGELEVENDQGRQLPGEYLVGGAQRTRGEHIVAAELQDSLEQLEVEFVIVDDEDAGCFTGH